MNCFYHPDRVAIGNCKHCYKGLCTDCANDLEFGLACKDKHEDELKSIDMIIKKNAKAYSSASRNTLLAPIFYLFMGLVFAGYGYFSSKGVASLPFVMGVGFSIFAVLIFIQSRKLHKNDT